MLQAQGQELLTARELSENKAKILPFFSAIKLHSGLPSRACSLTVIEIIFNKIFCCMRYHGWCRKKVLHFSLSRNLKNACMMLFVNKNKRNWTLYHECESLKRGDSTLLSWILQDEPIFLKRYLYRSCRQRSGIFPLPTFTFVIQYSISFILAIKKHHGCVFKAWRKA